MNRNSIQITFYYIAFIQDDQMKRQELFQYNLQMDKNKEASFWEMLVLLAYIIHLDIF